MGYYPTHIDSDWERFEYYVSRYVPCPECNGRLRILDRNSEAVDHECVNCGACVQCKFSKEGPRKTAPPSSAAGWNKLLRKKKAGKVWFLTGNRRRYVWYNYLECKRRSEKRCRPPRHMSVERAKSGRVKMPVQHRYSFQFPAESKYATHTELRRILTEDELPGAVRSEIRRAIAA